MSTLLNLGTLLGKETNHSTVIIAKERVWLAEDGKTIVPDGDPRAFQLLAAKGQPVPPRLAARLGITEASLAEVTPQETIPPAEIKSRKTR